MMLLTILRGALQCKSDGQCCHRACKPQHKKRTLIAHYLPSVCWHVSHACMEGCEASAVADCITTWLGNSVRRADVPVVVDFHAPTSPEQRMWLRSTRVRVRRVAFHVDDKTSAVLLHDPTFMVGSQAPCPMVSTIPTHMLLLVTCVSIVRGSLGTLARQMLATRVVRYGANLTRGTARTMMWQLQTASESTLEEAEGVYVHMREPDWSSEVLGSMARFTQLRSLWLRQANRLTLSEGFPGVPANLRHGACWCLTLCDAAEHRLSTIPWRDLWHGQNFHGDCACLQCHNAEIIPACADGPAGNSQL